MCIVYILHSERINKFYTGYTCGELEVRIRKHNTFHRGFTGKTNDWKIVYSRENATKTKAIKLEKRICCYPV